MSMLVRNSLFILSNQDLLEQNEPFYYKVRQRRRLDHLIDSPGAEVMILPQGLKSIFSPEVERVSTFQKQLDMDSCC